MGYPAVYVHLTQAEIELALDALNMMRLKSLRVKTARAILVDKLFVVYDKPKELLLDTIVLATCEAFHLHPQQLLSKRRLQHLAFSRQIAFYLCRTLTKRSFPQIGRYFKRDHSTVIHGVNLITARMAHDSTFRGMIHRLQITIGEQPTDKSQSGVPDEESRQGSSGEAS